TSTLFPSTSLFRSFCPALGLGQTAVDQGGVPIGSVEADPFESAHGSDLFLTERGGESRHATVDGLIGVAIGGAARALEPHAPEGDPLEVVGAGGEGGHHTTQRRARAALALGPVAARAGDSGNLDRKSTRLNSSHVKISY